MPRHDVTVRVHHERRREADDAAKMGIEPRLDEGHRVVAGGLREPADVFEGLVQR